ncbi:RNA polymerase sigma factor [Hansschlegelia plantiphila]|uniref:DNA-directed RNA polymerase sigma-70 factor n=1 Tax=Hansschlegelia plantiphila TaxID=374655 RepID=A0A9W6J4E2_9HYPH|nr:RNA polymerase sigma factor [Hansschlegelia plantiphila]GLK69068.1 DNA-directed RNA polymerase sigma-70 factor [Hansschlegelia plantiphila]
MPATLTAAYLSQRRSLMGSVMRIVRDTQAAEDVAQESYLRARRAMESGPIEHIEAFLHQTARNLALDHVRRRSIRERVERPDVPASDLENIPADGPSLEETVIQRERFRCFETALAGLPERARRVWTLNRIDGWTYTQIAAHLGVSANTVFNDMKMAMGHCLDALNRNERT